MSTVKVEIQLSSQELLKAVEQLSLTDLDSSLGATKRAIAPTQLG